MSVAVGAFLPPNRKLGGESESGRMAGRFRFAVSPAASGAVFGGGRFPDQRDASLFFPAIRRKQGRGAALSRALA